MKKYKVFTAKTQEEAEAEMNRLAQQGRRVTAVTFWQTAMRYRLVVTMEQDT